MANHLKHIYDENEVRAVAEKYNISEGAARQKIYQRNYRLQWAREHTEHLKEYRKKYYQEHRC